MAKQQQGRPRLPKSERAHRITLTLYPSEHEALATLAARLGSSKSRAVAKAVYRLLGELSVGKDEG